MLPYNHQDAMSHRLSHPSGSIEPSRCCVSVCPILVLPYNHHDTMSLCLSHSIACIEPSRCYVSLHVPSQCFQWSIMILCQSVCPIPSCASIEPWQYYVSLSVPSQCFHRTITMLCLSICPIPVVPFNHNDAMSLYISHPSGSIDPSRCFHSKS